MVSVPEKYDVARLVSPLSPRRRVPVIMRNLLPLQYGFIHANDTSNRCACDDAMIAAYDILIHGGDSEMLEQTEQSGVLRIHYVSNERFRNVVDQGIELVRRRRLDAGRATGCVMMF